MPPGRVVTGLCHGDHIATIRVLGAEARQSVAPLGRVRNQPRVDVVCFCGRTSARENMASSVVVHRSKTASVGGRVPR